MDSRKLNDEMVREKIKHYKAKNAAREKKEKNRRLEGFVITVEDMLIKQVLIFTNFIFIQFETDYRHLGLYHRNLKSLGQILVKCDLSLIGFRLIFWMCFTDNFFTINTRCNFTKATNFGRTSFGFAGYL